MSSNAKGSGSRRRYQQAKMILNNCEVDQSDVGRPDKSSDTPDIDGRGVRRCRSEVGSSEVSSTIARPKNSRLIKVIASSLADRIAGRHKIQGNAMLTEGTFTHPDASGGGTRLDVAKLLNNLIRAMNLPEKDTGSVLICMHHVLRLDDVALTAETWRPLVVTALFVSIPVVRGEDTKAGEDLLAIVAHWWPATKAQRACHVFQTREAYASDGLTPAMFADHYFALRQQGLTIDDDTEFNGSSASAVQSYSVPRMPHRPSHSSQVSGGSTSNISLAYSASSAGGDNSWQRTSIESTSRRVSSCLISL